MATYIYESVLKILKILENNGFSAFIVGGAVRDYCVELYSGNVDVKEAFLKTNDIDIASSARPDEVVGLFSRTFLTGQNYGTVTILMDGYSFEHTTFRNDIKYPEGSRKPEISFSKTLKEDVSRRDFTMNSLAMDSEGNIIDFFGGCEDIKSSIIRCVGNPNERLAEDPLRKLRAIRFAAQKNFDLDIELKESIKKNPNLLGVSFERIRVEMDKIMVSPNPTKALKLMLETGLLEEIIPEIIPTVGFEQVNPHHQYTVFKHILKVISNTSSDKHLRWAALFHDISKPACFFVGDDSIGHFYGHEKQGAEVADEVMKRLKFSNEDRLMIKNIVLIHGMHPELKKTSVRRWLAKLKTLYGVSPFKMLEFFKADHFGKKEKVEQTTYFDNLESIIDEIYSEKAVFSRSDLAISGLDLIKALKLSEENHKLLKPIFEVLVEKCIENPDLNEKNVLIGIAGEVVKKISSDKTSG